MDAVSYSYADKQAKRIGKFIENPDSTSGIVTVPKVIASGETVTIPSGRVAILPNVQIDGVLNVEGEVFIPSGSTMSQVIPRVTSTDNAIVRFDGTTGEVQNSSVVIDDSGNVGIGISSNLTAKINLPASDYGEAINYYSNATEWNRSGVGKYVNELRHYIPSGDNFTWVSGGPSGTERMRIDSAGRVTMPYQPGFKAFGSVGALTGSGSVLPYGNTSVPHNVGGGFNSTNSRFTAPVSGFYHFSWQFWAPPNQAGTTQFYVNGGFISRHGREGVEGYYEGVTCSTEVYLNSGDYVYIGVFIGEVHLGVNLSYFSGFLIG